MVCTPPASGVKSCRASLEHRLKTGHEQHRSSLLRTITVRRSKLAVFGIVIRDHLISEIVAFAKMSKPPLKKRARPLTHV